MMNPVISPRCLFAGMVLLCGGLVAADAADAEGVVPVSRDAYLEAVRKIDRETRRKPMAAAEAYLEYFEATEGLDATMRFGLHRRILENAFAADDDLYARNLARLLAEPEHLQKGLALYNLVHKFAEGKRAAAAEAARLFGEHAELLTPQRRLLALGDLGKSALRIDYDIEAFTKHVEACKALSDPAPADDRARQALERVRGDTIAALLGELMKYDTGEARKLADASAGLLSESHRLRLVKDRMLAALANKDRAAFAKSLAEFQQAGDAVSRLGHYGEISRTLARDDHDAAEALLRDALADPAYGDAHRHRLLSRLLGLNRVRAFNYTFHTPGAYEKYKALAMEDLAVVERGIASGTIKRDYNLALNTYLRIAGTCADFGDTAFARAMLSEARRDYPTDYRFVPLALRLALQSNSLDLVRAVVSPVLENPKEKKESKRFLRGVLHLYGGGSMKDFDRAVFGGEKVEAADRMAVLRRVSEMLFLGGHYDLCRRIRDEIFSNMFEPVEFKRYAVKVMDDVPKTADSWARSEFYDRWELMETRFVPYGDGYDMNNKTDRTRHLKDAEKPQVDPAYRTGVHIVCDRTGLHIFIRCDDPDIEGVVLGTRKGDGLELLLRPGEDAAYHSWYFRAAPVDTEDPWVVNWATPTKRYRLTGDFVEKDAAATADGFAAHTFIPWLAVYDKLPVDGAAWKFGLQRWGKAPSTLSGLVHELARALQLEFDFKPQELTALKRAVATMAFNEYKTVRRDKGAFIQTWNDKVLGDPEFYESEVKDLIAELDAAGEKLMAPAPDAEIAAIYEQVVPLWAEIEYVIADRRAAYLKERLLGLNVDSNP